jgi:hypothetical protein
MPGTLAIRTTGPMHTTTVIRLSPQRPGVTGSSHLPTGEAVPIGDLLSTVLARYRLREDESEKARQSPNSVADEMRFDVFA